MTRVILTDIEGTTSSISFVKEVLFPYARQHLAEFVRSHSREPEVQRWLRATAAEASLDPGDEPAIVATLRHWIDEDRKATPLKALQGMIWEQGYKSGAYQAHLYPEVSQKLRDWKADGMDLYVYSSGSVAAQKLFFGFSIAGDLRALFSGYFDTEIGAKRDTRSYAQIAKSIGALPDQILFLSDIVEELDAARDAGLRTTWLCRAPTRCPDTAQHPCVADFNGIVL